MTDPQRVLIFIPNWVGDVVMATPALRAMRLQFPTARIVHLMRPYVAEVLGGLRFCDEQVFWPAGRQPMRKRWGEFTRLVWELRRERFDMAVLLTNSFRTAFMARLVRAERRVGYLRDGRGGLLTDPLPTVKSGKRYVPVPALDYYNRIARYLGCEKVHDRMELATVSADEAAIDTRLGAAGDKRPLVVLNPGANFGWAKCWPAEYFAALSDMLIDRLGARVIASTTPRERSIADRIRAAARRPLEIFVDPPLGLGPLKALIRRASLLVTNDTGPRHFASAFGVPVVTVFGSSDPAWTVTRFAGERNVHLKLECQPCMKRVCPLKHHNCMQQLEPEAVYAKAAELIGSVPRLWGTTSAPAEGGRY